MAKLHPPQDTTSANEVWADVPGFEGLYQISTWGRVKSLSRPVYRKKGMGVLVERILKTHPQNGYPAVGLHNGTGKKKDRRVHTLVGQVFLPKPIGNVELNHVDHNKMNPRLDNLEWLTHKENAEKALAFGRLSGRTNPNRAKKLNLELVGQIRQARETGASFSKIAATFGICIGTAHAVVTGTSWSP